MTTIICTAVAIVLFFAWLMFFAAMIDVRKSERIKQQRLAAELKAWQAAYQLVA